MAITSWKKGLIAGAALTGLLLASGAQAQARSFNLPAEDATKAIPQFAAQAGVQIVAPSAQLKGVRTRALQGQMDARAALRQLLEGTGLEIASDNGSVISLRVKADPAPKAADGPAPAATTTPADNTVVVVTGSRLATRGFKAPTPVTVLDAQEYRLSGTQNVEQLLRRTL